MLRLAQRSTLFPYTTLFRSLEFLLRMAVHGDDRALEAVTLTLDKMARGGIFDRVSVTASSARDRKSTRLNSSHDQISYAVYCLKKKINKTCVKQAYDTFKYA